MHINAFRRKSFIVMVYPSVSTEFTEIIFSDIVALKGIA